MDTNTATLLSDYDLEQYRFSKARVVVREDANSAAVAENAASIQASLGISKLTARILAARGFSDSISAHAFLFPSLKEHLPDPLGLKNIKEAARLVLESIQENKAITIFCDFDVDGLSAGSQLYLFLKALGAKVSTYTPSRFHEGYGLSLEVVKKLAAAQTQLLITVDCGISNFAEITSAVEMGMKVLVIDHHQVPDKLPPADVIVNPAQEGCAFQESQLCAAGVVWLFLIVLRATAREMQFAIANFPDPKDFLELAALGTICDMVPLRGVNRLIAMRGVEALQRTTRPGINALKQVAGISKNGAINSGHVGFAIGPRINAAGRIGDANDVLELLTTMDAGKANVLAEQINKLNMQRRGVEQRVLDECYQMLAQEPGLLSESAFALYGKENHVGVIGIVAQRLVEHFHRPATVMAPGEVTINGKTRQVVKGSVRSIRGFDVVQALTRLKDHLIGFGGHEMAGGFSLEFDALADFQKAFRALAAQQLSAEHLVRERVADIRVALSDIDIAVVTEIAQLAPFGISNPSPLLFCEAVDIESVMSLANGHLRMKLQQGKTVIPAVAWKFQGHPLVKRGNRVSVVFQPELNTYQGITSIQLNIKEILE